MGVPPSCFKVSKNSGIWIILEITLLKYDFISSGVPLGTTTPVQELISKFAKPLSASVGTSGNIATLFLVVTAKAFNLPAFMYCMTDGKDANIIVTCPLKVSKTAGPVPLYGI